MRRYFSIKRAAMMLLLMLPLPPLAQADVQRFKYEKQGNYLIVELLEDDIAHFEYGRGSGPGTDQPITVTDMVCQSSDNLPDGVCKTDYSGPNEFQQQGDNTLDTKDLRFVVDPGRLTVTVMDKARNDSILTTFGPLNLHQDFKGLVFTRTPELDVYGLGQQFVEPGKSDIDWDGRVREGGDFGNIMAGFNGGANGNTQIPVMYAVNGASKDNYAMFLDNKFKQRWDFQGDSQWKVEMFGDQIRFYIMTGPDLLDLRKDYMDLVGHPLVPPKRMFGLWVSEYGYDRWDELENKLNTLRDNHFPLDGFVLDLQWFGGIPDVTGQCRIGSFDFDENAFPNPANRINSLENEKHVGVMLIEEAYVCDSLPEHGRLKSEGCLVDNRPGDSTPVSLCGFFGCGGMIDYTDDDCSRFWHDDERQKLVNLGVIGHWTDLGEPEVFSQQAGYAVGTHAEAHNIFNFRWLRGIYEGYRRNDVPQRPFMMSRSGAAGIQRFGTAMWSGDIAARLTSLAAHAANQMHMSFSGIDYYGGDIGGFHRNLEGDLNEMYSQWYAYGMMFDIPGRPHVENLCNCKETAPDRIGNIQGNLANTRLRYSLIPYVYSLAHRAYLTGEPVMPPLVMVYQTDNNVRTMGHEKLIGRDLLAAIVAKHGETERDVYLPLGTWVDWHSGRRIPSQGEWLSAKVPVAQNGVITLPLYARAGAIIPTTQVDDDTLNALGERSDGSVNHDLMIRVFPADMGVTEEKKFTLYEDDGKTIAYQDGAVRTTRISQSRNGEDRISVTVAAAEGSYNDAPESRNIVIDLVTDGKASDVRLNGSALPKHASLVDFNNADTGWIDATAHSVLAKSGAMPISEERRYDYTLEEPNCTSSHRTISIPGEGNGWRPDDPARTLSQCDGKTWSGLAEMNQESYKFAADGAWTVNWGSDGLQDGPNFPQLDGAGFYEVRFNEDDPTNPVFTFVKPSNNPPLQFSCENGDTTPGVSVYVMGNVPGIGQWDACRAVKLAPTGPYPTWTGQIAALPTDVDVEWKCIKRQENNCEVIQWEPGDNNVVDRAAATQIGAF